MEREDVYTQVLVYNYPKERQSMIGLQVLNRLDKGARNLWGLHIQWWLDN